MRSLIFGATLMTAFLVPVGQAAAQCCGAGQPAPAAQAAAPADHAHHGAHAAAPAPGAPAMSCCAGHQAAAPAAPAQAGAMACCGEKKMAAKPAGAMACCNHGAAGQMAALPADDPAVALAGLGLTLPPPVRYIDVTFRDPVRVGNAVLMGEYLIEHDDERMARGEPCTYIYDADDLRAPVVTFHCEHLERPVAPNASVVLVPGVNSSMKVMKEFQFGGETASHGVPAVR